jgi:hypothetical protein|tara:strand:- start:289 stop:804 length:516 start_codon:yes stop_codon:yes gene_type:complete
MKKIFIALLCCVALLMGCKKTCENNLDLTGGYNDWSVSNLSGSGNMGVFLRIHSTRNCSEIYWECSACSLSSPYIDHSYIWEASSFDYNSSQIVCRFGGLEVCGNKLLISVMPRNGIVDTVFFECEFDLTSDTLQFVNAPLITYYDSTGNYNGSTYYDCDIFSSLTSFVKI